MSLGSTIIGIQCRISSSRLPCKALLELADTTILGMCIERAKSSEYPVFLLTSNHEEDDLIAESALRYGVHGVIRGSLDNVLSRYVSLFEETSCDRIVRVTADNPLTEYSFVDPLIRHVSLHSLPYAWVEPSLCPEGTNIEIFTKQALFESAIADTTSINIEHVTPFLRRNLLACQCMNNTVSHYFPFDCRRLSFTVDTLFDYIRLVKLINLVRQECSICWRSSEFVKVCAEFASNNSWFYANGHNHSIQ